MAKLSVIIALCAAVVIAVSAEGNNFPSSVERDMNFVHKIKHKEYYLETYVELDFWTAYRFCNSYGMRLAIINNEEENAAVIELLSKTNLTNPKIWVSGNDLGKRGDWLWLSTSERFTFTNWAPNEPAFTPEVTCLRYQFADNLWRWHNVFCTTNQYFICERDI